MRGCSPPLSLLFCGLLLLPPLLLLAAAACPAFSPPPPLPPRPQAASRAAAPARITKGRRRRRHGWRSARLWNTSTCLQCSPLRPWPALRQQQQERKGQRCWAAAGACPAALRCRACRHCCRDRQGSRAAGVTTACARASLSLDAADRVISLTATVPAPVTTRLPRLQASGQHRQEWCWLLPWAVEAVVLWR